MEFPKARTTKAELLAEVEASRDHHISFLQKFVQAPSPNPPGDTVEATRVVTSYLKSHEISPDVIAPQEDKPNIVHDFEGGRAVAGQKRRLILNGHIDVFPAGSGDDWTPGREPWSGFIDEETNRIYGRGVVDMKAGTAASIIAYTYLHKYRSQLRGSLGLNAVSDEETGGRWGSRYLLFDELGGQQGDRWRGDVMINAEPGGLGTIRFAEKGTLRITFTVRTQGAHGAYVHLTESATMVAAEFICRLRDLVNAIEPDIDSDLKEYMQSETVKAAVEATLGKGASKIILKPTLNIGTLHGGLKVNMIPDTCVLEADIRLPLGLVKETVLEKIETFLIKAFNDRTGVSIEMAVQEAASNAATSCPHQHPMIDIMAKNAASITGSAPPVAIPSIGATDCKFWRRIGVPAYVFGVSPETMGARDENTSLDDFMTVVKVHVASAWDYLGGDES